MKVAKKWLSVLSVLVPVALVATGCTTTETDTSSPSTEGLSSDMEGNLVIWYYDGEAGLADLNPMIEQFKTLYPNVTFELEDTPGDQFHGTKLPGTAVTQEGPDLIWYNPAFTKSLVEAGVIASLDDEWAGFADKSQFPESILWKQNGSIYGVNSYVNHNAMWFNKSLLDELGVGVPTTLEELEAAMAAGAAKGYNGFQFAGTTGVPGEWNSRTFFSMFGVGDYTDYGNPNVLTMFETLNSWVDNGYLDRGNLALDQGDGVNVFLEGKTLFYLGGNWQLSLGEEQASFDWGVAPMPSGPGGPGSVYLGGQGMAVGAYTTNKALAWEFLAKTFMSKEHGVYRLGLGSIPARADVLGADVSDQVKAYVAAAQTGIPLPSDTEGTLLVGTLWSGLMQGQLTPAQAYDLAKEVAGR